VNTVFLRQIILPLKKVGQLETNTPNGEHVDSYETVDRETAEADLETSKKETFYDIDQKKNFPFAAKDAVLSEDGTLLKRLVLDEKFKTYSKTGPYHQYVTASFGDFIHTLAHKLPEGQYLYINDASLPGTEKKGTDTEAHEGHETGRQIDIKWPTTDDSKPPRGDYNLKNSKYSFAKTIELIRFAAESLPEGESLTVRFNDDDVKDYFDAHPVKNLKLVHTPKHDDHLHLEFTRK
jgi:hypothetical protein